MVFLGAPVVKPPGISDFLFHVRQFLLQLQKIVRSLEIWVAFSYCQEAPNVVLRAEGAPEATKAGQIVVNRWILCSSSSQP